MDMKKFLNANYETEISKCIQKIVKEQDEFLMKKLSEIEHEYVGYRINKSEPEPCIYTTDMYISETSMSCNMSFKFIGFDNEKEVDYYIDKGFNIFSKKDIKEIIKGNNILKFGKDEYYENYGSLLVEDYLRHQDTDKTTDTDCKKMILKFALKYIHKDLYIVEGVKDNTFYILIENEDDEIIDRLYIGELIGEFKKTETWDDYSLLSMPMRVEDHLRLYAILDDTDNNDKLEAFKEVGKYLGLDKYICSAIDTDLFERNVILISDKDGIIIEKINH